MNAISSWPAGASAYAQTMAEPSIEDANEPSAEIELEEVTRTHERFVTGVTTAAVVVSRFAPEAFEERRLQPLGAVPDAPASAMVDALRVVPFEVWKRVPTYAFLTLLLGNGMRCGGLSLGTNLALLLLIVFGLIGVFASLSQRNP